MLKQTCHTVYLKTANLLILKLNVVKQMNHHLKILNLFHATSLKNILFSQMSLKHLDFYGVMVNNIVLKDIKGFDINEAVISINTGNFKNEIMIKGIDAVNYFTKMCTYE